MAAVCIKCGYIKKMPWSVCKRCSFDPTPNDLDMARSICLSDNFLALGEEHTRSKQEMEELSKRIESGQGFDYDDRMLADLLEQKRILDEVTTWQIVRYLVRWGWPLIVLLIAIIVILILQFA